MKKVLIIAVSLIAFANIVFADFATREWAKTLKAGEYTCPYKMTSEYTGTTSTCTIGIAGGGYSLENCPDEVAKLDTLVKSGKCTFKPEQKTTYSCQYAQGSCIIENSSVFGTSTACSGNVSIEQAKSDYKAGKCYKN